MKKIFLLAVLTMLCIASYAQEKLPLKEEKIEIVTTLFPTYDFARQIGEDKINVVLLLPPGVESHAFEPRPGDIAKINKADIFIYTGKLMEPWIEGILKSITNKDLLIVDASQGIKFLENNEGEDGDKLHHDGKDPHIWLDLGNAQIMANTIAAAFAKKDPGNIGNYLNNAKNYNEKIANLDNRFKETFSNCKHNKIIYGGHFAFGYFVKRYSLGYESPYDGFSPNAEPSPKAIVNLIKKLKETGINTIYYEELIDPKVARIIAEETKANLELLHGAHNISKDELSNGVTFIDIMENNLKKLKIGLECQ